MFSCNLLTGPFSAPSQSILRTFDIFFKVPPQCLLFLGLQRTLLPTSCEQAEAIRQDLSQLLHSYLQTSHFLHSCLLLLRESQRTSSSPFNLASWAFDLTSSAFSWALLLLHVLIMEIFQIGRKPEKKCKNHYISFLPMFSALLVHNGSINLMQYHFLDLKIYMNNITLRLLSTFLHSILSFGISPLKFLVSYFLFSSAAAPSLSFEWSLMVGHLILLSRKLPSSFILTNYIIYLSTLSLMGLQVVSKFPLMKNFSSMYSENMKSLICEKFFTFAKMLFKVAVVATLRVFLHLYKCFSCYIEEFPLF